MSMLPKREQHRGFMFEIAADHVEAMIDYDTEHDWQWPNAKKVRWVLPMKGCLTARGLVVHLEMFTRGSSEYLSVTTS